ncbi:MAG: selenocysteine-specific translation elongation factor [Candidatus Zixiibacteriota bacterium]
MFVMGTAGHVDHGKSSLVLALSGIDPDRLPEEKERGLTIDLGFAWMTTNSGQTVGIVDVPGHERFVKNMIAGVGAIDFVLFVVAADDGWMPQSSEHLAILEYLNVRRGLVAVTKKNLVESDWLQLVLDDVRQRTSSTFLKDSPIVAVDSLSGDGLEDLKTAIDDIVQELPTPQNIGKPRMYIDRAFSIPGRGAVVTGTLTGGDIRSGQNLLIVPGGLKARVRELQIHGQPTNEAAPGQRVAVNLAGVDKADLHRGQCLVDERDADVFDRLWTHVDVLPEATHPLTAGRPVLVLVGTAEPEGIAYPLEPETIAPGVGGLVELRLTEPIKARLGDHFVLRWPTPQVTIGGGTILDLGGPRRWRKRAGFKDHLRARLSGALTDYRETELHREGYRKRDRFLINAPFASADIDADIADAVRTGSVVVTQSFVFSRAFADEVLTRLVSLLRSVHKDRPYAAGVNLSQLSGQLDVEREPLSELLRLFEADQAVGRTGEYYHVPEHTAQLPAEWADESKALWRMLTDGAFQPPTRAELEAASPNARAIVAFWQGEGRVVVVGEGILLPAERFAEARERIAGFLGRAESITPADVRDLLNTTRKYAVPILEACDREGLTRRVGDVRVLAHSE